MNPFRSGCIRSALISERPIVPVAIIDSFKPFGIKGLIEVPELDVGDKNDFLSKLFARVRENIAKECEVLGEKTTKYEEVMKQGKELVAAVTKPEDVQPVLEAIGQLPHELTSEKEIKSLLKKKLAELNITFDKATKTYVVKE